MLPLVSGPCVGFPLKGINVPPWELLMGLDWKREIFVSLEDIWGTGLR